MSGELPVQPPFWNVISLALPAVAVVAGIVVLQGSSRQGNYAGALGNALRFALALSAVGVLGEGSAIASLCRGERLVWLGFLGALVNAGLILPGLFLLSRADWS